MHMVTEYMPEEDENGNTINPKELMASMSGYATRLANLVNIGVFYKAFSDPHLEQGRTSSSANVDGNGAPNVEPSPGNTEKSPQDIGMGPQDSDIPTNQAAAP